jgi:ribosomal protein S18 acetylase RimI-like enzyme
MNTEHSAEFDRPTYNIVTPTVADAEGLATVSYQSWIDTYPNEELGISAEYVRNLRVHWISEDGIQRVRERIKRLDTDTDFFLRVAKDSEGSVVGFIDGVKGDDAYELQDLFTNESTHGSGLGTQLWENFRSWTDPKKPVQLSVVPYTERAPAFYKKVGFHEVPNSEGFYKDTIIPTIKMERPPEL